MPPAEPPDDNFNDAFPDNDLTDDALESEIELVSELVVAATSSDRPLHQDEVDALLGVYVKQNDEPTQSEG